ncbi:MAG: DMT family protein [Phycisphaerales bacterium]|nr:DMT family protein [Phycisphaerales bacterium]
MPNPTTLGVPTWLFTTGLLLVANVFMTFAWYFHLRFKAWPLALAILVSWGVAFFEYVLQVPANRFGHVSQGGPFTAAQLKIIQEAITLTVFAGFSLWVLGERLRWNEVVAFALIFAGVVVAMIGRE